MIDLSALHFINIVMEDNIAEMEVTKESTVVSDSSTPLP